LETEPLLVKRFPLQPARIELLQGDITWVATDAIVNAANSGLTGGGGVDGAIHQAAGPEVMDELRARYDRCPTGSAVITGSGRLAAHGVRQIVHAVGPVWSGGNNGEYGLLRRAYQAALKLADEAGARSVAFPAISCGVYGYPLDRGAEAGISAVRDGLTQARSVERVVFVLLDAETYRIFERALAFARARSS
jgi:O-acetyl-ADP-ribose deacetylase